MEEYRECEMATDKKTQNWIFNLKFIRCNNHFQHQFPFRMAKVEFGMHFNSDFKTSRKMPFAHFRVDAGVGVAVVELLNAHFN